MTHTYKAVEMATELAATTARMNNLSVDEETLHTRAYNWYCNSDVVDPEILAGCALSADYKFGYTYDDMLAEYKPFLKKPIGTDKRSTHIKHDTDICPVKSPWSDVGYPEVFALAKDIVDANDKYYTD